MKEKHPFSSLEKGYVCCEKMRKNKNVEEMENKNEVGMILGKEKTNKYGTVGGGEKCAGKKEC